MKSFAIAVASLMLAGLLATEAQTPSLLPYKSAHWKQTLTGGGQTIKAEIWFSNPDHMRVVTMAEGKRQVILMGGGQAYVYEEGTDTGLKIPLQKQMVEKLVQFAEMFSKLDSWKKNKSGTETIGDKSCDVYSFTDTSDGDTVKGKVWLWAEKNFPIRLTQEQKGQSVVIEHSDVEVDNPIPLSLFDPPTNMKFIQPPTGPGAAK